MLRLLLAALVLALALPASAQGLFTDADAPAALAASDLGAERARFVSVDAALLAEAPRRLHLNLFEDADVTATVRSVRRNDSRLAWSGVTEDGGAVSLTLRDGHLVGRMLVGGRAYAVRPAPGGHVVYEVREDAEGADVIGVKAPQSPVVRESLAGGSGETFDVLVVWSTDAEAALGGAAQAEAYATAAVDLWADVLANSGLPHTARLVHTEAAGYTSSGNATTDVSRLRNLSDGFMDGVHALRDAHGADFVALITDNGCGIAYLQDPLGSYFEGSAFSQSSVNCGIGNLTFPHELGHNLGVRHDAFVDGSSSPFTYSHGWAAPSPIPSERFRTTLAYNNACSSQGHTCPRQPFYSDPDASFQGRAAGDATIADATRHIDQVAATAAAFRPTASAGDPLVVTATPPSDPVEVELGGRFSFDIAFEVSATGPTSVEYWTEAILPNGKTRRALRQKTIALTPGATTTVTRRQNIPNRAPNGLYTYVVNVGTYPDDIQATASFGLRIANSSPLDGAADAPEAWVALDVEADGVAAREGLGGTALEAPVPNPASRAVTVPFTATGPVRLVVMDVLGRHVATLVEGAGAGQQSARLDVSALAPGVYLARMEAEGRIFTRRFTVSR